MVRTVVWLPHYFQIRLFGCFSLSSYRSISINDFPLTSSLSLPYSSSPHHHTTKVRLIPLISLYLSQTKDLSVSYLFIRADARKSVANLWNQSRGDIMSSENGYCSLKDALPVSNQRSSKVSLPYASLTVIPPTSRRGPCRRGHTPVKGAHCHPPCAVVTLDYGLVLINDYGDALKKRRQVSVLSSFSGAHANLIPFTTRHSTYTNLHPEVFTLPERDLLPLV